MGISNNHLPKTYRMREISITKGNEKYIFRYEEGQEDGLLDAIIETIKNKKTNFDWYDTAGLSFKLAPTLIEQADGLLKKLEK